VLHVSAWTVSEYGKLVILYVQLYSIKNSALVDRLGLPPLVRSMG